MSAPLPPDAPLDQLMSSQPQGGGRYVAHVPDGWQQGRGAFGGLVLGILARAMETELGTPDRSLRSMTGELCGPTLPGPVEVRVETLRTTSNVSTMAVRLVQSGEVQAHAVGVFARPRGEQDTRSSLSAPSLRSWREMPPLPMDPPFAPTFAQFWEFRSDGPLPFSGAPEPLTAGWIRPRVSGRRDAAWVVACADAWWPALFTTALAPRPVGTIAYSLQLVSGLDDLPDAPLAHFARDLGRHQGYAAEHRELWTEDGRLLALNQQTFAIIR